MRLSILACVLSGVAAICLYACVAHVFAARHPWFRTVHLLFAALAALAAVHALAHIAVYSASDLEGYLAASTVSNVSGALVMALLPWLVQGYFGGGPRLAPLVMSVVYVSSAVLSEVASVGSSSRPLPLLEQIVLPWGEPATIHRLPSMPTPLLIFWLGSCFLLGYIVLLAMRRRQRGGGRQMIAMVASIAILMLAIGGNMLVLADRLDMVFLGEFGFLALVLTMMRLLSGEQSYRAIIAQASAAIFVVAPSGRFLDVNRVGYTLLGRTRAELRQMSMSDVLVPVLPSPKPGDREVHWLQRKDGSVLIADMSTQVLADGRTLYIARDVTESQRVESATRLLAESAPETSAEQFFARCACSLTEAFGVRSALIGVLDEAGAQVQVVGRWPHDATSGVAYPLRTAPLATMVAERRTMHCANASAEFSAHPPFRGQAARGYLGAAIVSHLGEAVGIVEVWDEQPFSAGPESHRIIEMFAHRIGAEVARAASDRDLRQLAATLEARIAARTAQLAEVNEELEAFSYSVSHDLRAPVRAIDAHAGMLLEDAAARLDEGGRRHVERIAQAARRMRELIDGLLALARLSHQPQEVSEVDLSALARQAIDLLRERDPVRQVEFVCAPNVTERADPTGASIVVTNLIENAWKYSSTVAPSRIEFGCECDGSGRAFFVRDNGVGFDMQHAKHLFEPFRRLHTQAEFPGSGVGLATVQRIVKRHRGSVWARSSKGEGATFYFTLSEVSVGEGNRSRMTESG